MASPCVDYDIDVAVSLLSIRRPKVVNIYYLGQHRAQNVDEDRLYNCHCCNLENKDTHGHDS